MNKILEDIQELQMPSPESDLNTFWLVTIEGTEQLRYDKTTTK